MSHHTKNDGISSLQELIPKHAKSTLVVGDMARWRAQGRNLPDIDGLQFVDINALTDYVRTAEAPDIILSPLVSDDFDVMDVAHVLSECAYCGPYRAVTDLIPNPDIIRDEVRGQAPLLDFDLFVLPKPDA